MCVTELKSHLLYNTLHGIVPFLILKGNLQKANDTVFPFGCEHLLKLVVELGNSGIKVELYVRLWASTCWGWRTCHPLLEVKVLVPLLFSCTLRTLLNIWGSLDGI